MKFGECANCGYPVESDFVLCPNCHQRLKNLCGTCNHALEPVLDGMPLLRHARGRRPCAPLFRHGHAARVAGNTGHAASGGFPAAEQARAPCAARADEDLVQ